MTLLRICRLCNEEKELTNFTISSISRKTGLQLYRKDCKICMNEYVKASLSHRYINSKRNATLGNRNYCYELTKEDYDRITTNQKCIYCKGQDGNEIFGYYVGIDRVSNDTGYVIGNCVPCCGTCNSMKSNMSYVQFINICSLIAKNHNYKF